MAFRIAWREKQGTTRGAGEYCFKTREEAQPYLERYMQVNKGWDFWLEEEVWPAVIGADEWPEIIGAEI